VGVWGGGGGGGGGGRGWGWGRAEVSWELGQPPSKMCFIAVETLQIVAAQCGPPPCTAKNRPNSRQKILSMQQNRQTERPHSSGSLCSKYTYGKKKIA
jgi:hypothetical protein